jgi:hypothetical protein
MNTLHSDHLTHVCISHKLVRDDRPSFEEVRKPQLGFFVSDERAKSACTDVIVNIDM